MNKVIASILIGILMLGLAFVGYVYVINWPLPQDEYDVAIVERTLELLAEESEWAQSGDRSCEPHTQELNLYCALRQASIDVSGEFEHRSAALQQVRYAIERQRPGVEYAHRLMDYNNDPKTDFSDLRQVLQEALENLLSTAP